MDLREIRAYVPGDDTRRLDPAASARTGQPHIRSLHEDRDDHLLLIADFGAPMLWGTGVALRSVRAARHLVRAGWRTALEGGSVGLMIAASGQPAELAEGTGERQMIAICKAMALQHAQALATPAFAALSTALIHARRRSPPGGRVLVATSPDGWQSAAPQLADLARRREVTVAVVLDESEVQPPPGPLAVSDGQTSRIAHLSAVDFGADLGRLRALGVTVLEVRP